MAVSASAFSASAQYYQLANQMTNILENVIQGGVNYRGFFEAGYLSGVGSQQADFVELSTTHGFKKGNLFFMGIGIGVDFMNTEGSANGLKPEGKDWTTSAVMVPMYTDFRFNFGKPESTGFFIDLKIGAGFYVSNKYILVGDGYVNNRESFLLRPSLGVRVPVSKSSPKYAVNFGASYQLLTSGSWYNPSGRKSITFNNVGLSASFEW